MELSSILGMILGIVSVVGAMIFKEVSFDVFNNPAALLVIFVGTMASVLNSFTMGELKNVGKLFGLVFTSSGDPLKTKINVINQLVELSTEARKEGILSLEAKADTIEDLFLRKGLKMIVDGADHDYIFDVLSIEIEAMEERHALNASIFSSAGAYAPTLGVLGAVFGLIAAMGSIDNVDVMAHAISAAFIATILGIFTGYVMWNPFANKLKVKSKHEVSEKKLIIEGLLSIQKGDSPTMIKDKLTALLSKTDQKLLATNE